MEWDYGRMNCGKGIKKMGLQKIGVAEATLY